MMTIISYSFGILQLKIMGLEISLLKNEYTKPSSTIRQSLILFFLFHEIINDISDFRN